MYNPSVNLAKEQQPAIRIGSSQRDDFTKSTKLPGPGQYDIRGGIGGPKWGYTQKSIQNLTHKYVLTKLINELHLIRWMMGGPKILYLSQCYGVALDRELKENHTRIGRLRGQEPTSYQQLSVMYLNTYSLTATSISDSDRLKVADELLGREHLRQTLSQLNTQAT
jgi:hypothetical protein